jgi:hypothetical protein
MLPVCRINGLEFKGSAETDEPGKREAGTQGKNSVFAGAGIEREERELYLFEGFFLGLPLGLEPRQFAAFGAPHPGAILINGKFSHTIQYTITARRGS